MPLRKESKNLPLRPTVLAKLTEKYKRKWPEGAKNAPKFGTFANDLFELYLEKEDFLERVAPQFKRVGVEDNALFIKDRKAGTTVEIYLKDSELWCDTDGSRDCDHVHYALMLPDVARLTSIKRSR